MPESLLIKLQALGFRFITKTKMIETATEVFCEKGVLKNFSKIRKKTPVPESLF